MVLKNPSELEEHIEICKESKDKGKLTNGAIAMGRARAHSFARGGKKMALTFIQKYSNGRRGSWKRRNRRVWSGVPRITRILCVASGEPDKDMQTTKQTTAYSDRCSAFRCCIRQISKVDGKIARIREANKVTSF